MGTGATNSAGRNIIRSPRHDHRLDARAREKRDHAARMELRRRIPKSRFVHRAERARDGMKEVPRHVVTGLGVGAGGNFEYGNYN